MLFLQFLPLDKLICKWEFAIQKDLDVHYLLSENILTLQQVASNLSFVKELNTRLETFCILEREKKNKLDL